MKRCFVSSLNPSLAGWYRALLRRRTPPLARRRTTDAAESCRCRHSDTDTHMRPKLRPKDSRSAMRRAADQCTPEAICRSCMNGRRSADRGEGEGKRKTWQKVGLICWYNGYYTGIQPIARTLAQFWSHVAGSLCICLVLLCKLPNRDSDVTSAQHSRFATALPLRRTQHCGSTKYCCSQLQAFFFMVAFASVVLPFSVLCQQMPRIGVSVLRNSFYVSQAHPPPTEKRISASLSPQESYFARNGPGPPPFW